MTGQQASISHDRKENTMDTLNETIAHANIEPQVQASTKQTSKPPSYGAREFDAIANTLMALVEPMQTIEMLFQDTITHEYSSHVVEQVASLSESFRRHVAAIVAPLTGSIGGASS
jgi:hypothetical protein